VLRGYGFHIIRVSAEDVKFNLDYTLVWLKKEIKASINGIYIVGVKGLRAPIQTKKKWFSKKKKKESA
jgi:hypothetical protein